MPGVSRDNDTAGGDLIPSQSTVKANDELIIVDGDGVAGHGIAPHIPQTISADLQSTVKIGGVAVNKIDKTRFALVYLIVKNSYIP